MKLLVVYKYVVAILLLCTSCSNYKTELKDVESYINERPDSALAFLQSIDISSVKGKSVKNHYYLNCFGRIIILEEYSRMTIGIMMLYIHIWKQSNY